MTRTELLQLLEDLGRELVRLEMHPHVKHAREFYAELRAGRVHATWSPEHVVELARALRVPPEHEHYAVKARDAGCSRARMGEHMGYVAMVFPGGYLARCACGEKWIVLDGIGLPSR